MRATTNCTFRLSFSFDSRFSLPPPLFLPFVGSERTGKCWSGPPLLFLFHHGLPPFILLRDNTSRSNNENYSQRVGAIPVIGKDHLAIFVPARSNFRSRSPTVPPHRRSTRETKSLALIPIRPAAIAPLFFSRASKAEKLLLPRSRSISRNPMIPRRGYISPGARKFLLSLQRRSIRGAASLISSIREEIRERAARPTRYLAGVRWGRGCYIVAEAKEYRRGRGTLGYSR